MNSNIVLTLLFLLALYSTVHAETPTFDVISEDDIRFLHSTAALNSTSTHPTLDNALSHQVLSAGIETCNSPNALVKSICAFMVRYIDARYRRHTLRIERGAFLYNLADPTVRAVPTGHSCKIRAEVRSVNIHSRLDVTKPLRVSGNAFKEPIIFTATLPVNLAARFVVRYRFGFRFFGRCKSVGRDTFTMSGSAGTKTSIAVAFTLNPKIIRVGSRTFIVEIAPKVALLFDLELKKLRLRSSGRSPLTTIYIGLTSILTVKLRAIEQLFRGKPLKEIVSSSLNTLKFNFLHFSLNVLPSLPSKLKNKILEVLAEEVSDRVKEKANQKLLADQEDRMNQQLARIFGLSNGKKRFVLRARR